MKIITTLIFIVFFSNLFAQVQPVAVYGYNACDLSEETGSMDHTAGVEQGGISCECGVLFESMELDGIDDCAILDSSLKDVLSMDFSFGFYFFPETHTSPAALFSIKDTCLNRDSSMVIKFLPNTNEIEISLALNIADKVSFKEKLDPNKCWHHVTLTKEGTKYSFYMNGKFIESDDITIPIPFGVDYPFMLGSSSCVGLTEQKYNGRIDEIEFYDQTLSADQIAATYSSPDQITSNDTTIFLGNSTVINFEGSCGNINWAPITGLDSPGINPVATPDLSTQYVLTVNHGNCLIRDTINIFVVTEDDITCDQLLLPNAFTPNGDGVNDLFSISNEFIVENLNEFTIYDRWGAEIFYTNQKGESWDGRLNGSRVNPGLYAYKIGYDCKNESYQKIGGVSLLR